MQKSGGAVTLMKNIDVIYLAGGPLEEKKPLAPSSEQVCEFLGELSKRIQKDKEAKQYPDVLSFAFFCRSGNIKRLKTEFEDGRVRLGKGNVFHIAPSNIPINFAFTYVFGLLAGNANIVRVSATKQYQQVDIVCRILNQMFEEEAYREIKNYTAIITYERNQEITDALSGLADARVIWGGNETIADIRKSPLKPRCTEITFADRFSFGIISAEQILDDTEEAIKKLAKDFYNDTYLMDQNACSTPHLIIWDTRNCKQVTEAKNRFWQAVYEESLKYDLAEIKVSDKYVMTCKYAIELSNIRELKRYENYLYVYTLASLTDSITRLRGKFGLFFEYEAEDLAMLGKYINETVQTCAYYGIDKQELAEMIVKNHWTGIDRIVPFGKTLDVGTYWDGYDIVASLSRIIGV